MTHFYHKIRVQIVKNERFMPKIRKLSLSVRSETLISDSRTFFTFIKTQHKSWTSGNCQKTNGQWVGTIKYRRIFYVSSIMRLIPIVVVNRSVKLKTLIPWTRSRNMVYEFIDVVQLVLFFIVYFIALLWTGKTIIDFLFV